MGSGSAVFLGIRDRVVPYWWDQGRKLVMLLESRIRNLRTKNGFTDEKTYLVTTLYHRRTEYSQDSLSWHGWLCEPDTGVHTSFRLSIAPLSAPGSPRMRGA